MPISRTAPREPDTVRNIRLYAEEVAPSLRDLWAGAEDEPPLVAFD